MLPLTTTEYIWSEDRPCGERMNSAQDAVGRKQGGWSGTVVREVREGAA